MISTFSVLSNIPIETITFVMDIVGRYVYFDEDDCEEKFCHWLGFFL